MTELDKKLQGKFIGASGASIELKPDEMAPLPSGGKVYPSTSSLHDRLYIPIRLMTAEDEDILNNKAYLKQGIALDKLTQALLMDKSIDMNELIVGDKNAILLFVRVAAYGSQYDVDLIECDKCGKNFKSSIDLAKIDIKQLSAEPSELGLNKFDFTLPKLGKKVFFHLLTIKDDLEISKVEENKKKAGGLKAAPITTQLYHQIDEIEGVETKDKMDFIKKMPAYDSAALRGHIEEISPGPVMKSELVCPFCDDTREYNIPIGAGFFWPKGVAKKEPRRDSEP